MDFVVVVVGFYALGFLVPVAPEVAGSGITLLFWLNYFLVGAIPA